MTELVFLLEEPSARELLKGLLPRLLPDDPNRPIHVTYLVFEGKQDLEKNLELKLRGWRRPDTHFVILRDQDAAYCKDVKKKLTQLVAQSGRGALVRVACRELESWVLGDLAAVAKVFERPGVAAHATKDKFRDPDRLHHPDQELARLLGDYQKVDGARRMGPYLDPQRNQSISFRAFCSGVLRLVSSPARSSSV